MKHVLLQAKIDIKLAAARDFILDLPSAELDFISRAIAAMKKRDDPLAKIIASFASLGFAVASNSAYEQLMEDEHE